VLRAHCSVFFRFQSFFFFVFDCIEVSATDGVGVVAERHNGFTALDDGRMDEWNEGV
jgi:hypothetical protein